MESTRSIEANNKTYQKLKYKQNLTESREGSNPNPHTHLCTGKKTKPNKHIDSDSQMTNTEYTWYSFHTLTINLSSEHICRKFVFIEW